MRSKINIAVSLLFLLLITSGFRLPSLPRQAQETPPRRAAEIIEKLNKNFQKIKDASTDITLEYNLFFFGCSGLRRLKGKGYYKYPDKIKAIVDNVTYFARKNKIRKIDEKGEKFRIRLINSLDFSPGFHFGLMPHNFYLSIIKNDPEEIVIQGIPKPGILKNVTRINFYIDPKEYLLRKLDIILVNKSLTGKINIDYEKIDGIWVPTRLYGTSAVELYNNLLVGLGISLKGENVKINNGLSDKLFNPGF